MAHFLLEPETLARRCRNLIPMKTAVVHPCSKDSLIGAIQAAEEKFISPILIAPKNKLDAIAIEAKIDITPYEIIDVPHSHAAAETAVRLARESKAEAIMKGSLHTDELLHAIVHKTNGLRTERRISHIFVLSTKYLPKPVIITDAAINITPNLLTKRDIIQNAVDFLHAIWENGDVLPKVAILSAVETVNPLIPSTLDAAALCKMADRKQITGAILDGPLAYDNAISAEAAATKGIVSAVAGDADILLTPELESGNMLAKQLIMMAGAKAAGLILGARVPIILTSRSDSVETRIGSCALALLLAEAKRQNRVGWCKAALDDKKT